MSAKIRTYRNTEKFVAKLFDDLFNEEITDVENSVNFNLNSWQLRIKLDSANDTITVQDYITLDDSWRNIAQLYINDRATLEVKVNAELNGINSRIDALIMYMVLHIAHNGYNFFTF
jgi:hypothetical protein